MLPLQACFAASMAMGIEAIAWIANYWSEQKLKQHYASREVPDLIIPAPLHRKRLRQRGFNQAIDLAKSVAKQLDINIDRKLCKRIKHTSAQITLHAKQRQRNVRNTFHIKPLNVDYVAIIDDVMTTTSTVNELCKCLRRQGVKKIDVWVVARPGAVPNE